MTVNLADQLSRPVESAEPPPLIPQGHYFGSIKDFEFDKSSKKETPLVRLHVGLLAPDADVPADQLAGIDITKRAMRKEYYLTDDALYRLRELIESCKISAAGRSFDSTIPELKNQSVRVEVVHTPNQDPKKPPYANIGDLAGA